MGLFDRNKQPEKTEEEFEIEEEQAEDKEEKGFIEEMTMLIEAKLKKGDNPHQIGMDLSYMYNELLNVIYRNEETK
jgi:hypothetical protein